MEKAQEALLGGYVHQTAQQSSKRGKGWRQ